MKKIVLLLMAAGIAYACQNVNRKQKEVTGPAMFATVDSLLAHAEMNVDSMVIVNGTVSAVCPHGGMHCILKGNSGDATVMVMAGKETGSFGQDLIGSELEISGILRAAPMKKECLAKKDSLMKECPEGMEIGVAGHPCEAKCKHADSASVEGKMPCNKMKEQEPVPSQGKIPAYYIEGLSFVKDTLP